MLPIQFARWGAPKPEEPFGCCQSSFKTGTGEAWHFLCLILPCTGKSKCTFMGVLDKNTMCLDVELCWENTWLHPHALLRQPCSLLTLSACSLTANKFSATGYGHDFVFLAPKDSRLGVPPKKEVFLE